MDPFLGEIRLFAGTFAPVGWELCAGQLLSIAQNDSLFVLLGTQYGGDGIQSFGLPNLCGRAAVGVGQGPGLSAYTAGALGGVESVALTANNLAGHTHAAQAKLGVTSAAATAPTPATNLLAKGPDPVYAPSRSTGSATSPNTVAALTAPAGGNLPHENRQPSLALNYIIATQGIFPNPG
ncbi:phage tail protein [Hymenobacter lutimineralis]|uniref:Phage tail protein n=1 Tax=Hymenobacter lutimineralis TaxID=2606448 RepID=A0A5D6UZ54_9BACT|nr:tail fiber protein [Hymenobacter lutimineralis]TYZ08400.1 phage tail protein [Hymenobacter lutimineralis]